MSTNFSFVFNYTLILDDDKIVGHDSSDEDREPIEQASANRSRRPKQQIYQASLPGTSMEQRQRDISGRGTQSSDLNRADPNRRSSSMTRRRNNKHTSSHKRCFSSSGKKQMWNIDVN